VSATLVASALTFGLVGCSEDDSMSQEQIQFLSHLDQAKFFQRQGELKNSTLEARNAISLQPDDLAPYFIIIENLMTAGDAVNAERQLEQLLQEAGSSNLSDDLKIRASLIRAEVRYLQGNAEGALEALNEMDTPAGQEASLKAAMLRGNALISLERFDEAQQVFAKAQTDNPNSALPLVGLSKVAWAKNDRAAAREIIEQANSVEPNQTELWLWKGRVAQAEERWENAEDAYIRALEDIGRYDVMTLRKFDTMTALISVLREQGKSSEAFVYEEILAKSAPGTVKSNFEAAQKAYEEGNLDAAARYLEEIRKLAPNNERSGLMLGLIRFRQGQVEEAEKLLTPIVESGDSEVAGKLLAAAKLRLRDPEGAKSILENLEDKDTDPGTLALVGVAYLSGGDAQTGEELIKKSLELQPDNNSLRIRYATYLYQASRTDEAVEQARTILNNDGDFAPAQRLLIQIELEQGDEQGAIRLADQWVKNQPKSLDALVTRGQLASRANQDAEAKSYFQKAAKMSPNNPEPVIALGNLARKDGNNSAAADIYKKAIQLEPDNRSALRALSLVSSREELIEFMEQVSDEYPEAAAPRLVRLEDALKRNDQALTDRLTADLLERTSESVPSANATVVASIYSGTAGEKSRANELEQAKSILERGRTLFPENEAITLQAAAVAFRMGDESRGRSILQDAKKQFPDSSGPYVTEADYLVMQKDYKEAAELYELAAAKTDDPTVTLRQARALDQSGKPTRAVEVLEAALQESPNDEGILLALGMAEQSREDLEKAASYYEKTISVGPNNIVALNNLAWIYQQKGDDRALETAKKAYELSGSNGAVADTYGWVLFNSGKVEESLPILEKAHELSPESSEIAVHLSEAYQALGRNEDAKRVLSTSGSAGQ